jgi:predicted  nucleic acid-binding Zn-ribbon protein
MAGLTVEQWVQKTYFYGKRDLLPIACYNSKHIQRLESSVATAATKTIRPHESNDSQAITGASEAISDVIRRLSIGDEVFMEPDRLVPFEHWLGHIPFAFWLTTALRPRRLVELGTHRGNSYCAFCQAITRASIDCAAYAVDTWKGDVHMVTEQGLLDELRKYHDPRYGRFSKLIESTFDEASKHFSPGSIDLLHIDGTHTYDAVRADFETWRPMLSDRAVVLFHDINERQGNFGVWRVWEELALEFPHFAFSHSHGLGVLGVGPNLPGPVQALFKLEPDRAAHVRQMFGALGASMFRRLQSDTLTAALNEVEARANEELTEAKSQNSRLTESLLTARAETDALTQSLNIAEIQKKDLFDQVAGLKGTVNDLDARANEFESALNEAEAQKKVLSGQVATLEATATELKSSLNEAEAQKKALSRQVATLEATATELKSSLNEAEAQKKALSRQVATLEATANKLKSSLNYAEAQKKDLSGQVAGLEATANQLKSSLNYAEAQKNDLSEQVAMLDARAEELKSALNGAKTQNKALSDQVAMLDAKGEELKATLNGAKAQNKALLDQVAMLDAVIAERDKKINTVQCDEIALRAENKVLGKQLISALHSAHAFGTEVQTLRRSSSWKITRPLRVLTRLVRGEWAELKHIRRIRRFGS